MSDMDKNTYEMNDVIGICFAQVIIVTVFWYAGWAHGYVNGTDNGKLIMLQNLERWTEKMVPIKAEP